MDTRAGLGAPTRDANGGLAARRARRARVLLSCALALGVALLLTGCPALQPAPPPAGGDTNKPGAAALPSGGSPGAGRVLAAPSAGHLMLRGKDQLGLGKPAVALDLFRKAIAAGAQVPELHFYIARCHQALSDKEEGAKAQAAKEQAVAAYRLYLQQTPDKENKMALQAQAALETLAAPPAQP